MYGVNEVVIADTIGAARPNQVKNLFRKLVNAFGSSDFSAHFHDTRNLALSNVKVAMEEGVTKFDSCIAGLGGCPFAPGAPGNVATESFTDHEGRKIPYTGASQSTTSQSTTTTNTQNDLQDALPLDQKFDKKVATELRELASLKEEGILTDEEFEKKKKELLNL